MEDLYGVCFSANGDKSNPASFYISLSPDYGYLQRFAFKFVIKPFSSSVAGASGGSFSLEATEITATEDANNNITLRPNPHTHTVISSGGHIDYGISNIGTVSTNWRVLIDGIDITAYLIAQHDGAWINGQGVYPTNKLNGVEDFYDILEVCDVLTDEGEVGKREQILASTFKRVDIASDAPFGLDAYLYLKYDHTNR